MRNLALVPARGGSKRIPKKNIKDFLGKPILAYSIEAALKSGLFEDVIVSTDSIEIAEIAKKYGAEVPFLRSAKNSNDFATTADVINEVIISYDSIGVTFDNICCIYPCAPFVTSVKLIDSYNKLVLDKFDSVFPVVKFGFPIQRALRLNNGSLSYVNPEYALSRSQDLENSFHDAGQFYWLNSSKFIVNKKILSNNSGAIVLSELESQDIDTYDDWLMAELKYKLLNE